MLALVVSLAHAAVAAGSRSVEIVSERRGAVFTEAEKIDLALRVTGRFAASTCEWKVTSADAEVRLEGAVELAAAERGVSHTAAVAISVPRCGIYTLDVVVRQGRNRELELRREFAVLPEPAAPSVASPWGIFFVPPSWFEPKNPRGPEEAAASIRRLGASWVRLGFWEQSFGDVRVEPDGQGGQRVKMDTALWQRYAKALRAEGLHVMGGLAQVPRALSSKAYSDEKGGDGGPIYVRVPPRDYDLWRQFVEQLARDFADTIGVWEIWNEPDNQNEYFVGTQQQFYTLVRETARALRRGNPSAKIAGCGFTSRHEGIGLAGTLMQWGVGEELDILTVHYTSDEPGAVGRWRDKLKEHRLDLPVWNTEERDPVALQDRIGGVPYTFKFLHVAFSRQYDSYGPLVDTDYNLLSAGLAYAIAAKTLGEAKFVRSAQLNGATLHVFARGNAVVGVLQRGSTSLPQKLPAAEFSLTARASTEGADVTLSDLTGSRRMLRFGDGGTLKVPSDQPVVFIEGCTEISPLAP